MLWIKPQDLLPTHLTHAGPSPRGLPVTPCPGMLHGSSGNCIRNSLCTGWGGGGSDTWAVAPAEVTPLQCHLCNDAWAVTPVAVPPWPCHLCRATHGSDTVAVPPLQCHISSATSAVPPLQCHPWQCHLGCATQPRAAWPCWGTREGPTSPWHRRGGGVLPAPTGVWDLLPLPLRGWDEPCAVSRESGIFPALPLEAQPALLSSSHTALGPRGLAAPSLPRFSLKSCSCSASPGSLLTSGSR